MYYCTTLVLNSRVLLMYTDTVKELPGYPVKNYPSGSFLSWGGPVGREGIVYDIVWMGCPRRTPWTMLHTPVFSYSIVVSHLRFNFLCLVLPKCIYLSGPPSLSILTLVLVPMLQRGGGGGLWHCVRQGAARATGSAPRQASPEFLRRRPSRRSSERHSLIRWDFNSNKTIL